MQFLIKIHSFLSLFRGVLQNRVALFPTVHVLSFVSSFFHQPKRLSAVFQELPGSLIPPSSFPAFLVRGCGQSSADVCLSDAYGGSFEIPVDCLRKWSCSVSLGNVIVTYWAQLFQLLMHRCSCSCWQKGSSPAVACVLMNPTACFSAFTLVLPPQLFGPLSNYSEDPVFSGNSIF